MPRALSSASRGATLIEVMAALAIFSVGLLGVMHMNVLALNQNNIARNQSTATKMARDLADAFERLPYHHPMLALNSALPLPAARQVDPPFLDFAQLDGLRRLNDPVAPGARPLLSIAQAVTTVEGTRYEVAWRGKDLPDLNRPGESEGRIFVIMVRYRMPGGRFQQVNVWTVKYNPDAVVGSAGNTIQEI
jgi:type IV pilus assembly protein PilV